MTTSNAGTGGHLPVPFSNSLWHLSRWAREYDPWKALSCPDAPAKPKDTPRSHEASANQLWKTSWLPSGRNDPNTSSTLQCNRAASEFKGVVENPRLGAGTLRWAKKLLQLEFSALTAAPESRDNPCPSADGLHDLADHSNPRLPGT